MLSKLFFNELILKSKQETIFYAGIGSRETPEQIQQLMKTLASYFETKRFILRSGGADGADIAFESGVKKNINKQIFLPWEYFNKNYSDLFYIPEWAFKLTEKTHPYYSRLKYSHRKLMARNCLQILGSEGIKPSSFVICWTHDGSLGNNTSYRTGGTGQALRIAYLNNITIFNLQLKEHFEFFNNFVL